MKLLTQVSGCFALGMLLSACGFHLQGDTALPTIMDRTSVQIQNPYSAFARQLMNFLEQGGTNVVETAEAGAILEIPVNEVRKEILTIGDNARVREYRLRHRVQFRLVDPAGEVLIPEHSFEQSRVISFDEQDILAAAQEEEFLLKNMSDTLARLVIRHLGSSGI